jgi:hypothetical protein
MLPPFFTDYDLATDKTIRSHTEDYNVYMGSGPG